MVLGYRWIKHTRVVFIFFGCIIDKGTARDVVTAVKVLPSLCNVQEIKFAWFYLKYNVYSVKICLFNLHILKKWSIYEMFSILW